MFFTWVDVVFSTDFSSEVFVQLFTLAGIFGFGQFTTMKLMTAILDFLYQCCKQYSM